MTLANLTAVPVARLRRLEVTAAAQSGVVVGRLGPAPGIMMIH